MKCLFKRLMLVLPLVALCIHSDAKVRLPKVISDCMVLQRGTDLNIWGWADPGEKVTVRFQGNHYYTQADGKGEWKVVMPPQKAGGPYIMEVNDLILRDVLVGDVWLCSGQSNQETDIKRLFEKYPEIPVSNNHMIRMYKVPTQQTPGVLQEDTPEGERWHSAVSWDVPNWKALAYFYAVEAYENTGIPQGMLVSSLGGSTIESWISEEYLLKFPEMAAQKARIDSLAAASVDPAAAGHWTDEKIDDSDWDVMEMPGFMKDRGFPLGGTFYFRKEVDIPASMDGRHARIYLGRVEDSDVVYINGVQVGSTSYFGPPRKYDIPAGLLHEGKNTVAVKLVASSGAGGMIPDKPYKIQGDEDVVPLTGEWKYKNVPVDNSRQMMGGRMMRQPSFSGAGLFNGMIYPVRDYNVRGCIWYQGESNSEQYQKYADYLKALIANWRETLNAPELPFLICQLPNYMEKHEQPTSSDWAGMREAQTKVAVEVPFCHISTCYDTGEWNDIHPLNKKDLAKRLFLGARKLCYGEKVVATGPIYKDMEISGNKIIISFTETGGGLKSREGKLQHFAIAGEDRNFVWADAVIKGNKVIVSSPEVPAPVAVRYAWADNPDNANLCNKEGLLASPFRTDTWDK